MTGRLWNFINRIERNFRERPAWRALAYAAIAAALLLTWLFTDGAATDFVYSEF